MLETTLPPTQRMELLQRAYVHAVVAHAGASAFRPEPDNGADLGISPVKRMPNGKYCNTGFQLYCQLKSTTAFQYVGDEVIYDMEPQAYNKLVEWEGVSPCILVLYCMPRAEGDWLGLSETELTLRHCCYWLHLQGTSTSNTSTIRVKIPQENIFDSESIARLLKTIREQSGSINYDL
ncbi:MAG: DUF4365 domain-containing protein [Anaerolineae bacterium]|nr:DUF4365 domain-containing protein [Anaerolineae bacterium]